MARSLIISRDRSTEAMCTRKDQTSGAEVLGERRGTQTGSEITRNFIVALSGNRGFTSPRFKDYWLLAAPWRLRRVPPSFDSAPTSDASPALTRRRRMDDTRRTRRTSPRYSTWTGATVVGQKKPLRARRLPLFYPAYPRRPKGLLRLPIGVTSGSVGKVDVADHQRRGGRG